MYAVIIVVHIIACIMLIVSILLQSGRGGGLSGFLGAGAQQTIFGARSSTFLTRATATAAVVFLLTCISLTIFSGRRGKSLLDQAPIPAPGSSNAEVNALAEVEQVQEAAEDVQAQGQ